MSYEAMIMTDTLEPYSLDIALLILVDFNHLSHNDPQSEVLDACA